MSRRRRAMWAPRPRRSLLPSDDDLPLSLLLFLSPKKPQSKKKATPRKKAARAAASGSKKNTPLVTPPTPNEVINLDDCPESEQILNNVNEKIGHFMESGSFLSSDEDESDVTKTKNEARGFSTKFLISDDSDDDFKMVKKGNDLVEIDESEPSTSAGTSHDTPKANKQTESEDDIMGFVDAVLESNKNANNDTPLKDMKSLEDFRKETEEMLKNASSLLDEIKTGKKKEPPKEVETSPKVTVGSCPICLESLANKPAAATVCGHIFCKECITHTAQAMKKCPTCRKAINLKKIHPIYF